MNRTKLTISILVVFSLLLGVAMTSIASPRTEKEEKIKGPISTLNKNDVYTVPKGSTIVNLSSGATKILNPKSEKIAEVGKEKAEKVSTPGGEMQATHVYQHPSGSHVLSAGKGKVKVIGPDGELLMTIVNKGKEESQERNATGTTTPGFSGWIEKAYDDSLSDITYFEAEWQAPQPPSNGWFDDDVTFLFPSVKGFGTGSYSNEEGIVQPVLQYNQEGEDYGNPYEMASWVYINEDTYHESTPISVSEGDSLYGDMIYYKSGDYWMVSSMNRSTNKGTTLYTDLMQPGYRVNTALEGHNLETDSDLFDDAYFNNMVIGTGDYIGGSGQEVLADWDEWRHPDWRNYFTGLYVTWSGSSHTELHTNR